MKWFNCKVDDRSKVVGGAQRIETPDGYVLVYMHSTKVPIDDDLKQYLHYFFTSSDICDESVLDHCITPALLEKIHQEADDSVPQDSMFDEFGILTKDWYSTCMFLESVLTETGEHMFHAHLHQSNPAQEDWRSLSPYFGWQSEQVIQNTYKVTSQFRGSVPQYDYHKHHF